MAKVEIAPVQVVSAGLLRTFYTHSTSGINLRLARTIAEELKQAKVRRGPALHFCIGAR